MKSQGISRMRYKGSLIINSFLRTEKFSEHYEWLKNAADKQGIQLSLYDNSELLCCYDSVLEKKMKDFVAENDFIIYWDKDIRMGRQLTYLCRQAGVPIYNSLDAIDVCDDKSYTYQRLWEWNLKNPDEKIPMVPSIVAPMTYPNIGFKNTEFLQYIGEILGFPIVVKECFGSFGMQVYKAENMDELRRLTLELEKKPIIYQKFIEKSAGKDLRLQVVGDEVVAAMYRYSDSGAFQSNITYGGKMKKYKPSDGECQLALRATKAIGLDFAGVDLLFADGDKEDANVVCEVNSNAHFKNIFDCTGVNVAEQIMQYVEKNIC